MVVIPLSNDQPGIGARVKWGGVRRIGSGQDGVGDQTLRRDSSSPTRSELPNQRAKTADGDRALRRRHLRGRYRRIGCIDQSTGVQRTGVAVVHLIPNRRSG